MSQNGKGMTPRKGYSHKAYADNYGSINWGRSPCKSLTEWAKEAGIEATGTRQMTEAEFKEWVTGRWILPFGP